MTDAVGWHSSIASDFDAKYSSSPSFRERYAVWSALIARHVSSDSRVLDAGCGSGVFSKLAAECAASLFGFDGSREMVEIAKARCERAGLANARFDVAMVGDKALLQGLAYDVILCSSVLEYIDDYWQAFDWLASGLAPAGVMVWSMPNGASLYRKAERLAFRLTGKPAYYAHVRNTPTLAEVQAGLALRGFKSLSSAFYAEAPLVSKLGRAFGRADLADNLFVVACTRQG